LKTILPTPTNVPQIDKKQCEYLDDFDPTSQNSKAEGGNKNRMEEEDEEEGPAGAQRVQCNQQ